MPAPTSTAATVAAAVAMAAAIAVAAPSPAAAQAGCAVTTYTDPPREVLRCPDGLSITAERASDYRLIDRNRDGRPEAAELKARALLIESRPGRGGFQILTPHAIATVRGTTWAVDVAEARTSVFVREGAVGVTRPGERAGVTLRAGDGVDVAAGGPLEVKIGRAHV